MAATRTAFITGAIEEMSVEDTAEIQGIRAGTSRYGCTARYDPSASNWTSRSVLFWWKRLFSGRRYERMPDTVMKRFGLAG